ncbi:MAG: terminase large subunit domain-containing protein [Limnochordia bacterium]
MERLTAALERWKDDRMTFRREVLVLPDGRSYGASLEPWQAEDLAALDRRQDLPNASIWRPRGHSKTSDLAAECVAELFLGPKGGRLYAAAVDKDQASLLHELATGYIRRTQLLAMNAEITKDGIAVPATGARLTVLSSDAPSAYGLLPTWICCDELAEWPDRRLFDALFSATGKVPGCRFVTIGTCGVIGHWSEELYHLAQNTPGWYFKSRGQCASWIKEEWLEEQRRLLPAEVFRRLHLNEWVSSSGSVLTEDEVQGVFDNTLTRQVEGKHGVAYFVGVDLGLVHDRTVRAIVHREGQKTVVDSLRTWQGSREERVLLSDVEDDLLLVNRAFKRLVVSCDFWQAAGLVERLQASGLRCVDQRFTTAFRQKLDSHLLQLIRDGLLKCYPHEELMEELRRLQVVQNRNSWRLDHPSGGHDDHVTAVALAALAAEEQAHKVGTLETGRINLAPAWSDEDSQVSSLLYQMETMRKRARRDGVYVYEFSVQHVPGDER